VNTSIYADGTYLKNNPTWHDEDAAWKAVQIMKMLAQNPISPQTICEVGCGTGQVLVELQKELRGQTSFCGYEISPDAFRLCVPKTNKSLVFKLETLDVATVEPFDLMLVLDVLEHVENYMGFLRSIRSGARSFLFHIPIELTVHSLLRRVLITNRKAFGHLHHFTKDTALATLEDCGYRIVDWFYTPSALDFARPGLKAFASNAIRRTGFRLFRDPAVLILGGYSLMAMAEKSELP
jgi:SAM-dependent methyltransferase